VHSFHLCTDHEQCKRVPNCISLITGLEKEIGVTESQEVPEFREFNEGSYRMEYFFVSSRLIFKSSIKRKMPSLAAAPFDPAI